jgi:hypothetical protein
MQSSQHNRWDLARAQQIGTITFGMWKCAEQNRESSEDEISAPFFVEGARVGSSRNWRTTGRLGSMRRVSLGQQATRFEYLGGEGDLKNFIGGRDGARGKP